MKKNDIYLIICAVLIVVVVFFATGGIGKKNEDKTLVTLNGEEVGLVKIDYETYTSKIKNNENFIIVLEQTGCSFCEKFLPIVKEASEELGIAVYDLDISELSKEEYTSLGESNSYLRRNSKWGTPTTLLLSGEEEIDNLSQYVEKEAFVKFIKDNVLMAQDVDKDIE